LGWLGIGRIGLGLRESLRDKISDGGHAGLRNGVCNDHSGGCGVCGACTYWATVWFVANAPHDLNIEYGGAGCIDDFGVLGRGAVSHQEATASTMVYGDGGVCRRCWR
jgi:hypothetical protein